MMSQLFNPKCSSLAKKHLNLGQSNANTVPDIAGKKNDKKGKASDHGGVQISDIFGSRKEKSDREPSAAKDYSPASASDLSLLSALKLADDVRQQQDSQRSEVNISGIILL